MIRRAKASSAALLLIALSLLLIPAPATAQPPWTPPEQASIRPGAVMITGGSQCTANFIFHDDQDVYIGQAAHCSAEGPVAGGGQPNGCLSASLPIGTPVGIEGATQPGTLIYNSWITMRQQGEQDRERCMYNDFALVKLDPADHANVNPTMPHWGGPTGLNDTLQLGDKVLGYGSSELRAGLDELSPKEGFYQGRTSGGWGHTVFTLTPGIPGDSGSGLIDGQGRALGVVSTLIFLPEPLSNGVADLTMALDYMRAHTDLTGVELAEGTGPFTGQQTPLEVPLSLLAPVINTVDSLIALLGMLGI